LNSFDEVVILGFHW